MLLVRPPSRSSVLLGDASPCLAVSPAVLTAPLSSIWIATLQYYLTISSIHHKITAPLLPPASPTPPPALSSPLAPSFPLLSLRSSPDCMEQWKAGAEEKMKVDNHSLVPPIPQKTKQIRIIQTSNTCPYFKHPPLLPQSIVIRYMGRYQLAMCAIEKFSFSECILLKEGNLVAKIFFFDL